MKKNKIKFKRFFTFFFCIFLCASFLSVSCFAYSVTIDGINYDSYYVNYNLTSNSYIRDSGFYNGEWSTLTDFTYLDFLFLYRSPVNLPSVVRDVSPARSFYWFCKALGIDITLELDSLDYDKVDLWFRGGYIIFPSYEEYSQLIGPVLFPEPIYDFHATFNLMCEYFVAAPSSGLTFPDFDRSYFLFQYNDSLRDYFLQNLVGLLNDLGYTSPDGLTPETLVYSSVFNTFSSYDRLTSSTDINSLYFLSYNRYKGDFTFPSSTFMSFDSSVNYVLNKSNWSWLPSNIFVLITSFLGAVWAVCLSLGIVKMLKMG